MPSIQLPPLRQDEGVQSSSLISQLVPINTPGSYTCQCRDGFEGRDCLINIDDCADKPCLNGGTCLDETDGFKCLCVDGFGGELCQKDIDECESQPCLNGA